MPRKRAGLRFPFACYRSRIEQPLPSRSEPQHSRATVRLSEKGITIMMPRSVGMVVALLIVSLNTAFAQSPPPVSFFAARTFGAGSNPDSVAVGDFNGDGKPDLAVANFGSNIVPGRSSMQTVQNPITSSSPTEAKDSYCSACSRTRSPRKRGKSSRAKTNRVLGLARNPISLIYYGSK